MQDFILKELKTDDLSKEFFDIGFESSYIDNAVGKFRFHNLKIYDLTIPQLNILKQTALSCGADCATHKDVLINGIEKSDCILGATETQLKTISEKLKLQQFGMKIIAEKIESFVFQNLNRNPKIMGILNLDENSFSDGGEYSTPELAVNHVKEMISQGADIIDIGAESTKPNSLPVSDETQLNKIIPILEKFNGVNIPISIDTRSSVVADECLKSGASIINDVSGLEFDPKIASVVSKYGAKIVIQHSSGTPDVMQNKTNYENLMDEIYLFLDKKIGYATSCGVDKKNIIVDPGIGFGKTREQNFEIIRRIEELRGLGCPIMLGISRKSLLNMANVDNFTKDIYTMALNTLVLEHGVDILRVHNVELHKKLLNTLSH